MELGDEMIKDNPGDRKELLEQRLTEIKALEAEIKKKEKELKAKESAKKQVPLRLSSSLWEDISRWADEDFRSVNGQIEYLLSEAVRRRKKGK